MENKYKDGDTIYVVYHKDFDYVPDEVNRYYTVDRRRFPDAIDSEGVLWITCGNIRIPEPMIVSKEIAESSLFKIMREQDGTEI